MLCTARGAGVGWSVPQRSGRLRRQETLALILRKAMK
jgi:hypothetical protein